NPRTIADSPRRKQKAGRPPGGPQADTPGGMEGAGGQAASHSPKRRTLKNYQKTSPKGKIKAAGVYRGAEFVK
ncbi:MAG: hypothetical protein AABZ64_02715, partial [Nitrospinota bacterium]